MTVSVDVLLAFNMGAGKLAKSGMIEIHTFVRKTPYTKLRMVLVTGLEVDGELSRLALPLAWMCWLSAVDLRRTRA